jgi:transposase InsO family protein
MDVALDTCAGCNLVRKNQVPHGAVIKALENPPSITAAEGNPMVALGSVELFANVAESSSMFKVEFYVVESLVVPALLGTPWIDRNVICIDPLRRLVSLQLEPDGAIVETSLRSRNASECKTVRVAVAQAIPAFSETWIQVRTECAGLSLLCATRRKDRLVQVKNAVVELPSDDTAFRCLVANFGNKPFWARKGHVLGIAEPLNPLPTCAVSTATAADSWEDVVRQGVPTLAAEDAEKLLDVLRPHACMWDGRLGEIRTVEHHIPTEGPPIAAQPYRAGPSSRSVIDTEIKRMLSMDVIEPASGPWSSPIVLIPKPDGSIRFCVDYRRLNTVTANDSYALPRVDDCLDSLGAARYFTTLDANSGYWQIPVAMADRDKTAFTSHRGLYRFKRLPFGLKTAPATFQRAIDVILSSVRFQCALTYLDDIVIYSPTFSQHLEDLSVVLKMLQTAGVSLKLNKCSFAASQVQYLGFKVGVNGVEVDATKTAAIKEARAPRNKNELRRFLGMTGFYRKFIENYARKAAPLTRYLKDDVTEPFELDQEAIIAHEALKTAVTTAPVLALPNSRGKYILETDASASQLGVQLLQEQDDATLRPVGFWSRQCNSAEKNYSPTEREALAIVWGVKMCRPYVERTKFKVRSDHQALRWLFTSSTADGNPRLVRWKLALSAYEFVVEYKPGASNRVADELSCMETTGISPSPLADHDDAVPCLVLEISPDELPAPPNTPLPSPLLVVPEPMDAISLDELLDAQQADTWCQDLMTQLKSVANLTAPPGLVLDENGVLCYKSERNPDLPVRWVAPASLRERICKIHHFAKVAGHPGGTKMTETVSRRWYWPGLGKDCVAMVRRCPSCAASRLKRGPKRTYPLTIFPPERPLEFIAIDVLGPLPTTSRGNRFVLCICDRFTKMSVAVAMKDQTASTIALEFVDRWLSIFGAPLTLLSDNGSAFACKFFKVLTNILGIRHVFTSAYRPETNGQVERWNATLVDMLAQLSREKDWDQSLGLACLAYNSSVHSSTGYAPMELACTREPAPSIWARQPSLIPRSREGKLKFRHELLARAAKLCSAAKETNTLRLQRYKYLYDHHVRRRSANLQVGDSVFVRTHMIEPGRSPKLSYPVSGPYPVVELDGPHVVVLTREGRERLHLDRVMRCPTDLPSGVEWAPPREVPVERRRKETEVDDEYVIDRLISHGRAEDDSEWLVRVRWAGFSSSEDTWEPACNLPAELVRKYEKRKRLQPGLLCSEH